MNIWCMKKTGKLNGAESFLSEVLPWDSNNIYSEIWLKEQNLEKRYHALALYTHSQVLNKIKTIAKKQ